MKKVAELKNDKIDFFLKKKGETGDTPFLLVCKIKNESAKAYKILVFFFFLLFLFLFLFSLNNGRVQRTM